MLENVAQIQPYFFAVHDDRKLRVVEEVLKKFAELVTPILDRLPKGPIHGDMNEYNILVTTADQEHQLTGILDFGDICYSCQVFDLAVAMTYMMWQCGDLNAGGVVLAGYDSVRPVRSEELEILKVCVAARLSQSLVMSSYTYCMDPCNKYVLTDLKGVWELLLLVWSHDDDMLLGLWESVGHIYNLKREKSA
jgi:hydroxylysine kinase